MASEPASFHSLPFFHASHLQTGRFLSLTPTWTIRGLSTPATPTYLKTRSSIPRFRPPERQPFPRPIKHEALNWELFGIRARRLSFIVKPMSVSIKYVPAN